MTDFQKGMDITSLALRESESRDLDTVGVYNQMDDEQSWAGKARIISGRSDSIRHWKNLPRNLRNH
jgi:hypothetical protein